MAFSPVTNPPYTSGAAIIPELWANRLGKAITTHSLWARFASPVILDTPIAQKGNGQLINFSHSTELPVDGSALVATDNIVTGTNQLIDGVGTVQEFGKGMALLGHPIWLSDPAYMALANTPQGKQGMDTIKTLVNWGVKTWDVAIGNKVKGTELRFAPTGTTANYFGTVSTNVGTANMNLNHLADLKAGLGRMGAQPREDLGNLYGYISPPGGLKWLNTADKVQRDAASLGISEAYTRGFVGAYGGFAFFEELGANSTTTYKGSTATLTDDVGTSFVLCEDALAGNTDMGGGPDFLIWYPDMNQSSGRQKQMNIYFRGMTELMLTVTGTNAAAMARVCEVNYVMRDI